MNDNGSQRITVAARSGVSGKGGILDVHNGGATTTIRLEGDTGNGDPQINMYAIDGTPRTRLVGDSGIGGYINLYRPGSPAIAAVSITAYDFALGKSLVTTDALRITGGADLSEQFDVETLDESVKPGMVVS